MTDISLEFIAEQLERVLAEQASVRTRFDNVDGELGDMHAGLTVLTEMAMKHARDMVQVKNILGRLDNRIAQLEKTS